MKKLLLAGAIASALSWSAAPAWSQTQVGAAINDNCNSVTYGQAQNRPLTQNKSGQLCTGVTVTFSPSGTQDVNLTKVGGTAIALGQTTKSASLPVTIASDQPPISASPRVAVVSTTATLASTGYAAAADIGGAISIAGGVGNSTPIRIRSVTVAWTVASQSAAGIMNAAFFSAAPASTITDGSAITWNSADAAKFNAGIILAAAVPSATSLFYGTTLAATANPSLSQATTTDGSGNINLVLVDNTAITYTTPTTATVRVVFEY